MTIWTPELEGKEGPRYQAIATAIAEDIGQGKLEAGAQLPTHRDLARRLGVTVGTVSRAYAEAERRGLISGEVGRGSFVRGARREAPRFGEPEGSETGGIVDLGLSVPATPVHEEERRIIAEGFAGLANRPDLSALLRCQPYAGSHRHREVGAQWIRGLGLDVRAEEVLVCCGAQHAMAALFSTLCEPGSTVLTEDLTYPGMKALAQLLHLRLVGLAMDEEGIRPDALEAACRSADGGVLYTIPTLQNPTGVVMGVQRRQEIASVVRRHGLTLIEDDVFGFAPADRPPPIATFAREHSYYLVSTSKLMAPGLRIGFLAAPESMVNRLGMAVFATAWLASPPMAELVSVWIEDGTAARFAAWRREDALRKGELARRILGQARCRSHAESFHLWLELPEPWRAEDFAAQARRQGVILSPASVFAVGRTGSVPAVRLCPTAERDPVRLERALHLLADLLEQRPAPYFGVV